MVRSVSFSPLYHIMAQGAQSPGLAPSYSQSTYFVSLLFGFWGSGYLLLVLLLAVPISLPALFGRADLFLFFPWTWLSAPASSWKYLSASAPPWTWLSAPASSWKCLSVSCSSLDVAISSASSWKCPSCFCSSPWTSLSACSSFLMCLSASCSSLRCLSASCPSPWCVPICSLLLPGEVPICFCSFPLRSAYLLLPSLAVAVLSASSSSSGRAYHLPVLPLDVAYLLLPLPP